MGKHYRIPLLRVRHIMVADVVAVYADDQLDKLITMFKEYGYHGYPVLDREDRVVGIARDSDVLRTFTSHSPTTIFDNLVEDIMRSPPATVKPEDSVSEALHAMFDCYTRFMPVVDRDDQLLGVITRSDIIRGIEVLESYGDLEEDACEIDDSINLRRRGRRPDED